jgi:hypothetical protein
VKAGLSLFAPQESPLFTFSSEEISGQWFLFFVDDKKKPRSTNALKSFTVMCLINFKSVTTNDGENVVLETSHDVFILAFFVYFSHQVCHMNFGSNLTHVAENH